MAKKYRTYIITSPYKSVYHFLKDNQFSENYITNLRKEMGNIRVNEKEVTIRKMLFPNDKLEINVNPNTKTSIMQCIIPLDIVYEDDYYLIINKPAGLPCMPSKSHYSCNLAGAICYYMNSKDDNFTLRIINRLDKDTEGLIIIAKDSISQKEIKDINKTYYALCEGVIDKDIVVNKKIKTVSHGKLNEHRRIIAADGQSATTFITPVKSFEILNNGSQEMNTLIKVTLKHGRTHQIRVHLSSIGHPLLGDTLYGTKSDLISHTALICSEISFYHTFLNKTLTFSVPLSNDFKKIIE